MNEDMEEVIYEGTELLARAFCHEIDHLDGKMYTDLVEGRSAQNMMKYRRRFRIMTDEKEIYMKIVYMGNS